jgi:hypothetical protein
LRLFWRSSFPNRSKGNYLDENVVELAPDEITRVEFEREAEDYVPVVDQP